MSARQVSAGPDVRLTGIGPGEAVAVPAFKVDAVDTTAAGDTFVGAFAVAQAEGRPVADAMRWASAAAALSVRRLGASASMPYRPEIDDLYGRDDRA